LKEDAEKAVEEFDGGVFGGAGRKIRVTWADKRVSRTFRLWRLELMRFVGSLIKERGWSMNVRRNHRNPDLKLSILLRMILMQYGRWSSRDFLATSRRPSCGRRLEKRMRLLSFYIQ
jgi:hypothetical protein